MAGTRDFASSDENLSIKISLYGNLYKLGGICRDDLAQLVIKQDIPKNMG